MQIKNLKIENFKGIEKYECSDIKRCTAFVGSNGKGKTSILDAFRTVITGNAPNIPVRTGCSHAIISADICGYNIERKFGSKNSVRLNGKVTTQKSVDKLLSEETHATVDTMEIATSSKVLAALNAGELSDYLVNNGLIPAEITVEDLIALCTMSQDAEIEIRKHFPHAPVKFNLDDIEVAYNTIFAERKILKQNIVALKAQATYNGPIPLRSADAVQKEMHKFIVYNNELDTYAKLLDIYNKALKARNDALRRLEEIEQKIKAAPSVTVNEDELRHIKNQKDIAEKQIFSINQTVATLKSNISIFKKTLENLDSTVCPISNKLVCTTDKTAAREEITKLLDDNQSELDKALAQVDTIKGNIANIDDKIADYNKRETAYKELVDLYNNRKAIKDNIPSVPEKPKEPVVIADADAEKLKLEKELEEIKKYNDSIVAQNKLDLSEKRVELLNELLDILGHKSGIREKIVQIALTPLVDHCNKRATELKLNFSVGMKAEKGVHIVCNPNTTLYSESLPLTSVSSGEQAYVLFLIMDALNSLTNLGLLVLDDLDKLDISALDGFFALLTKPGVIDNYNHILIAMVNHEDSVNILNKYKGTVIDDIINVNLI